MTTLTDEQLQRGLSLAERERATRWDWGDWAVDVAEPVGEDRANNGALAKLQTGLNELACAVAHASDLPTLAQLRDYRAAASAIPSERRMQVRSIHVGVMLVGLDVGARERIIAELAANHPKGIVAEHALRERLGRAPVGPRTAQRVTPKTIADTLMAPDVDLPTARAIAGTAMDALAQREEHDLRVRDLMDNDDRFDPSESWVDSYVIRVERASADMESQVKQWGLVFGTMPLHEALEWLGMAERRIADARAAVGERLRDQAREVT